jgi:hypothetical protein
MPKVLVLQDALANFGGYSGEHGRFAGTWQCACRAGRRRGRDDGDKSMQDAAARPALHHAREAGDLAAVVDVAAGQEAQR